MRGSALILTVIVATAASSVSGQPLSGDIAQGRALARKVCAECHRVEAGQAAGLVTASPTFQALADRPSTTAISLRVFLRTPHRNMPNLMLTEPEADDIIAYILSLK